MIMSNVLCQIGVARWAAPKAKPSAPVGRTEPRHPCRGRPPSRVGVAPASAMTAPPNPVPELVCGLGSNWNLNLT